MAHRSPDRMDDQWQVSPRRADGSRGIAGPHVGPVRVTPMRVVLVIALLGTLAYLVYALTVRDTSQIPMLASGAAVLGIVFLALAVAGAWGAYQAGVEDRGGRAFGLAVGGGLAAMIGFVCFAFAVVLALVFQQ